MSSEIAKRSVTVKRNVILRSVVNQKLRDELAQELQNAADEIDARMQQLEFQTRPYITDLQRTNLQQAMSVRKQVEAEKKRQQEIRDMLLERKAEVAELKDGQEITRGTLESYVELCEGDNIEEVLGGIEVVTQDDLVIAIRQRRPDEEEQAPVSQIIQEAKSRIEPAS